MVTNISKETLAKQLTSSLLQNNGLSSQTNSSKSSSLASSLANKTSTSTSTTSTKDVDIVTLSKEALALLEQEKLSKSSQTASDYGFTLTKKQEAAIEKVLEKYKSKTMNETVWKSILSDLKSAGLGVDKMTALERFKAFNPTKVMMSALFGNNSRSSSNTSASATAATTAQTKRAQFLKQVMADWQNLKTSS